MKINRTAKRTIEILELIATSDKDLTLNDITLELKIPKTSVFDILETLVYLNMIYVKGQRLKTYAIGIKAYVIGNNYSKTSLLLNSADSIIKELAEETGLPVLIAKENSGSLIYILKQEPIKKIIATPEVGDTDSLHSTASGKAILAYAKNPLELLEHLKLSKSTSFTITSKTELMADLFQIRSREYAVSDRESAEHIFSIAAPIFDYNQVVSSSLEVFCLYQNDSNFENVITAVVQAAQKISQLLDFAKIR